VEQLTERRLAATHEAAHVAVAAMLDRHVESVRLNGDGGQTVVDLEPGDGLDGLLASLTILVAGAEAERYADPNAGSAASTGDIARARRLAASASGSAEEVEALIELARAKARTLLRRPTFGHYFEPFLTELLARGELDRDLVEQILKGERDDEQAE
jgi:hypothetical protein